MSGVSEPLALLSLVSDPVFIGALLMIAGAAWLLRRTNNEVK